MEAGRDYSHPHKLAPVFGQHSDWLLAVQPAPVVHKETREIDISALKRQLATLPTSSLKQPFSSADFYVFGKTLGEGAYGKVKLGTHLLADEKVRACKSSSCADFNVLVVRLRKRVGEKH